MTETAAAERTRDAIPGTPDLLTLAQLIRERAIITRDQHWMVSQTGKEYGWLIDLKQIFLLPDALSTIAATFWDRFAPLLPFQVGGMETAAIPLVTAILLEGKRRGITINGFVVRKERKYHGVGKRIEGRVTGEPIVVVDDIVNSADSVEKVRAVLEGYGRRIDAAFVVIDYHSPMGQRWRQRHRVAVDTIFTLDHFGLDRAGARKPPRNRFATVWMHETPGANHFHVVPKSSPALDDARVYVGTDSGYFIALDQATGDLVWEAPPASPHRKGIWSSPELHDGKLYYGGYDGNVYARDARTGAEIWRYTGADWVGASPALAPERDLLFIGLEHAGRNRAGSIAALALSTGIKRWEHVVPDYIHCSPAYCAPHGLVAIGTNGGELLMFGANSGKLLWSQRVGGAIKQPVAFDLARDQLISGAFDGTIRVHAGSTGETVWSVPTGSVIFSTPLIVGDRTFVTSTDKHLYVLDLVARTVAAQIPLGAKATASPRLIEGSVFVGCNGGTVREIDPGSLEVLGTHQLPDSVTCAVAYNGATKRFFVPTHMNALYCFERSTAERVKAPKIKRAAPKR
jgi:outer membrane protein assembly factor BamB/orotate phosphoribosyltransferase